MIGWLAAALAIAGGVRAGSAAWMGIGVAVAAANVGALYLWPLGPCLKCKGSGRNSGSNRKRFGECKRCRGTGRRRRVGAKTVHRGAVSLAERARRKRGM